MRVHFGILVLALVVALSGCGGDDEPKASDSPGSGETRFSTPSAPMTDLTISCAEFADTAQKIVDAQRDIYARSGAADAVTKLAAELDGLKDGAPGNVKTAVDDLVAAFRTASDLMKQQSAGATKELAKLAPRLSEAGKTVSDYIVSKCTG